MRRNLAAVVIHTSTSDCQTSAALQGDSQMNPFNYQEFIEKGSGNFLARKGVLITRSFHVQTKEC